MLTRHPLSRQSLPNSPTLREKPRPVFQRNISDLGVRFKKRVTIKSPDSAPPVGAAPPYDFVFVNRSRSSILKKTSMVSLDGRHPNIPEMAEPDAYPSAPSNGDSSISRQRPMLVKQENSLFSDSVSSDFSADSHATDFYRCSSSTSDISDTENLGNDDESQRLLATPSDGRETKDVMPGLGNDHFHIDEDSQTHLLQLEDAQTRSSNS